MYLGRELEFKIIEIKSGRRRLGFLAKIFAMAKLFAKLGEIIRQLAKTWRNISPWRIIKPIRPLLVNGYGMAGALQHSRRMTSHDRGDPVD